MLAASSPAWSNDQLLGGAQVDLAIRRHAQVLRCGTCALLSEQAGEVRKGDGRRLGRTHWQVGCTIARLGASKVASVSKRGLASEASDLVLVGTQAWLASR